MSDMPDRLEDLPLLRPPIESATPPPERRREPRTTVIALQTATSEQWILPEYYHPPLGGRLRAHRAEYAMIGAALALSLAIVFAITHAVG